MNQKLTDSEIAKVFAMYLEQPVLYNFKGEDILCRIVNVGLTSMYATGKAADGNAFNSYGINGGKLLLTPLSKITDEHAIEISRILDAPGDCVERHKDHIAVYDRYNDNANEINTLRLHFIDNYELLHLDEMGRTYEFDLTRCTCVHQFLISKGYAVPLFFELNHPASFHTAIELSLAIEQTIKN